jgi:hypothetical protein
MPTVLPNQYNPARSLFKVAQMLAILGGFVAGVFWFGGMLTNRDPYWFYPVFDAQPTVICIYREGAARELRPGQAGYTEFVAAFNREIARFDGAQEGIFPRGEPGNLTAEGCTLPAEADPSLYYYRLKGYAIEVEYAEETQVHTQHFFPASRRLMLAIKGTFTYIQPEYAFLFRGTKTSYQSGALVIRDFSKTRAAAEALFTQP